MKKLKNILADLLIVAVLITSCAAFSPQVSQAKENEIYYIADSNDSMFNDAQFPDDTIHSTNFDEIKSGAPHNIITAEEMLSDSLKDKFNLAFADRSRLLVLGDTSESTLREYFGLESKAAFPKIPQTSVDENEYGTDTAVINVAEFLIIGRLIYQNDRGLNITSIYVEDPNNAKLVADTIDYCFSYDYLGLNSVEGQNNGVTSARDFNNSWSNVDIDTNTYGHERATITTSIGLDKNDGNPNSNGEYLFYLPYKVDVEVKSSHAVRNVTLDVAGNIASKVYGYGPEDVSCGPNTAVSFSLPKAISVSFTPGTRVAISKTSGGLDSNNFAVKYQPRNALGVDTYTADRMQCEAHIEGYQTGSYFQAYGSFDVLTYKAYESLGGAIYQDPLRIVNSPKDSAGGT